MMKNINLPIRIRLWFIKLANSVHILFGGLLFNIFTLPLHHKIELNRIVKMYKDFILENILEKCLLYIGTL